MAADLPLETITPRELAGLAVVESASRPWGSGVPARLRQALTTAAALPGSAADNLLAGMLNESADEPELWWGLALAQLAQGDLHNAAICYENFRDRVAYQHDRACRGVDGDDRSALALLDRLTACAERCRDHRLAGAIGVSHAGLVLTRDGPEAAGLYLRIALRRLRALWPRPWQVLAEWLATAAIVRADNGERARAVRTLALAQRLSLRDASGTALCARLSRDLGLLLDSLGAIERAEATLGQAASLASDAGDPILGASIAIALCRNLVGQRRYIEARDALEPALSQPLSPRVKADALLAAADLLGRLGWAHRDRNQLEEAHAKALEAARLLEASAGDPFPAKREVAMLLVLLGDTGAARRELRSMVKDRTCDMDTPEIAALAYIPYLLRLVEGQPAKALRWAEARLAGAVRAGGSLREIMTLREHCIAAAARAGVIERVRAHALAMLSVEAAMLAQAFGAARGPADWNRGRQGREALAVLAASELAAHDAEAPRRCAEALLAGRGLARAARRQARHGGARPPPTLASAAASLAPGEAILALVALHPPAPVDPAFAWASGFAPPQLVAIWQGHGDDSPVIDVLAPFAEAEAAITRWREDCAQGRLHVRPSLLAPLDRRIGRAQRLIFLAEGECELLPLALLAPDAEVIQLAQLARRPVPGAASGPVLALVNREMLDDPDWRDATLRELSALARAGAVTVLHGADVASDRLSLAMTTCARVHVLAHGFAERDASRAELDVYGAAGIALDEQRYISASWIAAQHLGNVDLAVLSACDTGIGVSQFSEGLASLAAAFLDAGAAHALAALWPVPHEGTARFMEIFYRQRLDDPAAALAAAQRDARAEGMPAQCWAAWMLYSRGD